MTQTERRGISASQKQELWERWKRGQSMRKIAALIQRALRLSRAGRPSPTCTGCDSRGPTGRNLLRRMPLLGHLTNCFILEF